MLGRHAHYFIVLNQVYWDLSLTFDDLVCKFAKVRAVVLLHSHNVHKHLKEKKSHSYIWKRTIFITQSFERLCNEWILQKRRYMKEYMKTCCTDQRLWWKIKISEWTKTQGGCAGYSCTERRKGNQCLGRLGLKKAKQLFDTGMERWLWLSAREI